MKTINGLVLKQMIISGANNLYNHYPEIDSLNVFPVPDGDTGTNMNLTISSGAKEVANRTDIDAYPIAKAFSKGLLMGARGNSGVILSQIFRGFAQGLEGVSIIKATDLAAAFMKGKEVAYKAVMRPVEGTILTVIREAAEALFEKVNNNMTIEKAFDILLKEASASLLRTPELLPVLKEVGVVDSGGAGLLKILEGFNKAIHGDVVEKNMATVLDPKKVEMAVDEEIGEFTYCLEFVLSIGPEESKKAFNKKCFGNIISSHGASFKMSLANNEVKVHVHVAAPGAILTYAQQYGEFIQLKIENLAQNHTCLLDFNDEVVEEEEPLKEYAIIAVSVGSGIDRLFKELNVDYIVSGGQTMNPSTEDFVAAINKVHAKKIFILPNNSNIVMAAAQACDVIDGDVEAQVIPSKSIPQGLVACMMFNPDATFSENFKEMKKALKTIKSGQVTFAIKDTVIDNVEITKDHYMGICDKVIKCCVENKLDAAYELVTTMIDDMSSIVTILYGEDVSKEDAEELAAKIENEYEDVEIDLREGNQPVYSFIIGVE